MVCGRCAGHVVELSSRAAHWGFWSACWDFWGGSVTSRPGTLRRSKWTYGSRRCSAQAHSRRTLRQALRSHGSTLRQALRSHRSDLRHALRSHRSTLRRHWPPWETFRKLTTRVHGRTWSRTAFRRPWFDGSRRQASSRNNTLLRPV